MSKVAKTPVKTIDKRCKIDKLGGVNPPKTKHQGALSRSQQEAQRTFQLIIKQNHSILEYLKREQDNEVQEAKALLDAIEEPLEYSTDEGEFTETGTQIQPDD